MGFRITRLGLSKNKSPSFVLGQNTPDGILVSFFMALTKWIEKPNKASLYIMGISWHKQGSPQTHTHLSQVHNSIFNPTWPTFSLTFITTSYSTQPGQVGTLSLSFIPTLDSTQPNPTRPGQVKGRVQVLKHWFNYTGSTLYSNHLYYEANLGIKQRIPEDILISKSQCDPQAMYSQAYKSVAQMSRSLLLMIQFAKPGSISNGKVWIFQSRIQICPKYRSIWTNYNFALYNS